MAFWIKEPVLELVSGQVKEWVRTMPSGRRMVCQFCPDCGTRLFHFTAGQPGFLSIKPGTLRDTAGLAPVGHIWVDSKQAWLALDDATLQYRGNPDSLDGLLCAWGTPP